MSCSMFLLVDICGFGCSHRLTQTHAFCSWLARSMRTHARAETERAATRREDGVRLPFTCAPL